MRSAIEDFIDPIYTKVEPYENNPQKLTEGQIVWAPVTFDKPPWLFECKRKHPDDHYNVLGKIRHITYDDFKNKNQLPIASFALKNNEELLVFTAKKRPCIFLRKTEDIPNSELNQKTQFRKGTSILLPLYSITPTDDPSVWKFPEEFIKKIMELQYDNFFYFPRLKGINSVKPLHFQMLESVGRLDRIFPARLSSSHIELTNIKLSKEFFDVLKSFLREFFDVSLNSESEGDCSALKDILRNPEKYS